MKPASILSSLTVASLLASCLFASAGFAGDKSEWTFGGVAREACSGKPARGETAQLVDSDGKLLAEDITGVDGSFILRPEKGRRYRGSLYLVFAGTRLKVPEDEYASWLQTHSYKVQVELNCARTHADAGVESAVFRQPADAGTAPEVQPVNLPSKPIPSKLIPHGYLGS